MSEHPARPEHTPAEKRRARLSCLCLLGAVGCSFAGVDTSGWASRITGGVALLLCGLGYVLIR